ncbi:MAG: 5-methyltetrahydropteroyltriglutamate--homocysteine S-methyltransferase [Planctomycetes bacterium]|nr:5-methyltetrahydropteroyltriglutamate--homocysteine S-methyltransferase [Planctomycetota bacterium]
MTTSASLGFPRIGANRELKRALEGYWSGRIELDKLVETGRELRRSHWQLQRDAGIDHIPGNDFSFYDHVLDTCAMVGAVPPRYGWTGGSVDLDLYFAMARGVQDSAGGRDVTAMEMTKWLDTNYHYIVPEFAAGQTFGLASTKVLDEFTEALELGITTRPVLLGPVSFLLLGKVKDAGVDAIDLLERLLPVYEDVLRRLAAAGAAWVQIDEPCLVLDLDAPAQQALAVAWTRLRAAAGGLKLMLTSYFGELGPNLGTAIGLGADGVHLDLVRGAGQLDGVLAKLPAETVLSLGVVDGRNVWVNDLAGSLDLLERAARAVGADRLVVATSCSLIHVPIDVRRESSLDPEIAPWLSFAVQKLDEVIVLARGVRDGRDGIAGDLAANERRLASRRSSTLVHRPDVQNRVESLGPDDDSRQSPYDQRKIVQRQKLRLPAFPTTTIGSFPQTTEVRKNRAQLRTGEITQEQHDRFLEGEIERMVRFQEEIGLDMLVHGEPERNDMVQYFGERLDGFTFTEHGWVQSYGSRYVRPPIIFGDVRRPAPMTVRWSKYAASLTDKPMKGMLTGPITILQWSFVRDDQPRSDTARQIALAIRDEVCDLEEAGVTAVQIDEPAIREGLPLRRADWPAYLEWSVKCFRLAASGVRDETQIHTHMCYSEFNDMIEAIGLMDADVISIESSRSQMELLEAFETYRYPNEIGPGVYDIHSPRVPGTEEMRDLLMLAAKYLSPDQIWVNPDCGLKTRRWEEVRPALENMVKAARAVRAELAEVAS